MRRKTSEIFLSALILELTNRAFNALSSATSETQLTRATLETHLRAHLSGALWAGLGLLGIKPPRTTLEFETVLHRVARASGIPELRITNKAVLSNLKGQATIATERISSAGLGNTVAIARGAGFATRWGVQQGIADMAQHSSAVDTGGGDLELLKTWVRLAARHEHRGWHDALEGLTIPYSQKFKIDGPNGTFLVDRPYDPSLPLSEKFACGHGLRIEPPRDAIVKTWNGS
jgi:hypothetical protein